MSGPDDGNTIMVLMLAWGAACLLTGYVLGYCERRDGREKGEPCCRESSSPRWPG